MNRATLARRDALNVYVWQHLSANPGTWFSAVELARVISQHYIRDGRPPSLAGSERWGRSNVLAKILTAMHEAGEVDVRPRQGSPCGGREWRWAQRTGHGDG